MKATPVIKPGDLVSLIGGLSAPSVVGISGYGGSEKSTLATWLTGAVALTDSLGSVSVAE